MNVDRLLAFAKFLDELPEELFDFGTITRCSDGNDWEDVDENMEKGFSMRHSCGAVGCAIGWLPAFDKQSFMWEEGDVVDKEEYVNFSAASNYFETGEETDHLFCLTNRYYPNMKWNEVKPKHVAGAIRRFVNESDN